MGSISIKAATAKADYYGVKCSCLALMFHRRAKKRAPEMGENVVCVSSTRGDPRSVRQTFETSGQAVSCMLDGL